MTWLAPGVGPAAPAASAPTPAYQPQEAVFSPAAPVEANTGFIAAPMPNEPRGSFAAEAPSPYQTLATQFPPHQATAHQATANQAPAIQGPAPYAAPHETSAAEESVPWDVVGVPRTAPAPTASIDTTWQASNATAYGAGAGAPTSYGAQWTPQPYATQYAAPYAPRRRFSGAGKLAVTVAVVVIGFGVRWGFGALFGGDFSADGPIEVDVPAHWTTYTVSNPDITYAMDSSWIDVSDEVDSGASGDGARLIDARGTASNPYVNQAFVTMMASTISLNGGDAAREDFDEAIDEALGAYRDAGVGIVSRDDTTILSSDSGERWAFVSGTLSSNGIEMDYHVGVAVVADYVLVVELIVPEGVAYTQTDLFAIANSVRER